MEQKHDNIFEGMDFGPLKEYLDNIIKIKLETSLNTTISDITILGAEELIALGCTLTGNETAGYSAISCDSTTPWYSKVFKNTYSWTRLRYANSNQMWLIDSRGSFGFDNVSSTSGARPIITVSKSVIAE